MHLIFFKIAKVERLIVLLFFVVFVPHFSICQTSAKAVKFYTKANKAFDQKLVLKADHYLSKAIVLDSMNVNYYYLLKKIGDNTTDTEKQILSLEKIIELENNTNPQLIQQLAEMYYKSGDFSTSLLKYKTLLLPISRNKRDSVFVQERINSCKFAIEQLNSNSIASVDKLNAIINTQFQEYWPLIEADDSILYFTRMIYTDDGVPVESLFVSHKISNGWGYPQPMLNLSDDLTNMGTICISTNRTMRFITLCGQHDGIGSCDIYGSLKLENEWTDFVNIGKPVNSKTWEAQPAISADNKFLYFSSRRVGGYGGMDIWRSTINISDDGVISFGNPKNLGDKINTPMNDYSPWIHADGTTLYFASEGHVGLGGGDLYVSHWNDGEWTEAENLGMPINSIYTDDGLTISPTGETVIFSSDREGNKDLYLALLPETAKPKPTGYLEGMVFDITSNTPLETTIEFVNLNTDETVQVYSSEVDGYLTTFSTLDNYALSVKRDGYLFYSESLVVSEFTDFKKSNRYNIYLQPIEVGSTITLKNVFFEFDSYTLKSESFVELDNIIQFLTDNPTLNVEIGGYTDNQGNERYNQKLSENRALAIYTYISEKIVSERLNFKGYGSTLPIAENDTEKGRAKNRRVELKIVAHSARN